DQVLACELGDAEYRALLAHQPQRGEQGEHDVGRALLELEAPADAVEIRRTLRQPGEEVEPADAGDQQVGRVDPVAKAIQLDWIGTHSDLLVRMRAFYTRGNSPTNCATGDQWVRPGTGGWCPTANSRYSLGGQAGIATERRNFSPSKSLSAFSMP